MSIDSTLFFMSVSDVQKLDSLVGSFKVILNAFCRYCRSFLDREASERLPGFGFCKHGAI